MTRSESSRRRAERPGERIDRPVARVVREGGLWRIRSLGVARQVLRARRVTTQAGFTAEWIPTGWLRHHPILLSDGPSHDQQRAAVGRFLAPKVVAARYGALMEHHADALLADVDADGFDLDAVALHYSVAVTAQIVGLTNSPVPAMARRLESLFRQPPFDLAKPRLGRTPSQWASAAATGLIPVVRFYLADVRPAIRERRRRPVGDIISHLIAEGYTGADILVECLTYGTAGMVTTREFITMAAWHLLDDAPLAARYRAAELSERLAILNEILRLEPVVGHLYRRARSSVTLTEGERSWTVAEGDLLDVDIRQANADPDLFGDDALQLCPGRALPPGVNPAGLAFGDGAHRCPGQPLATREADVLLCRLLDREPVVVTEPTIGWDDLVAGYTLRGLRLTFTASDRGRSHP